MLVFGGSSTRGGDGLNRTFGRPSRRAEGTAGLSAGRSAGRKYAEPIGTPNPGTVKSGGPVGAAAAPVVVVVLVVLAPAAADVLPVLLNNITVTGE